ncbi:ARID DNA-binding domain-containing protein [Tanacetum coccineum]|uniref:ARID DNA-binding domain-containing protein n=1 Tax=Tanacetum coccineum TaxID=301880 RepID=A0ABQ4Z732_9ASTR
MIVYKLCGFTQHFVDVLACLSQPIGIPYSLDADSLNHLASSQSEFLEQLFSREEIKRAVRDCGAEELGLYKWASFGCGNMSISHLIYADDVIFFGEWSWSNVLGVCISDEEVSDMENIIGCGAAKFPLKYLGVPVGCSMVKCPNWNAIIPSSLLNFPYGKLIYYQLAAWYLIIMLELVPVKAYGLVHLDVEFQRISLTGFRSCASRSHYLEHLKADNTVRVNRSIDGFDAMLENGPWFIRNNPLILKKWHPDENLLKEDVSTVPVWVKLHDVPVTAFSEDGLSVIATKLGTPLMLDSYTSDMCMQSWGRSSFPRVMIELRADVEFKDNIVVAMPKITRDGHYTCAGEKKTMKKPSKTSLGVPVGPKMDFKPQYEYRPVTKKPNASSSGNMKKGVEPTNEQIGGTTNLANNEATSSGSSFMNIDNNGEFASNNPIGEKIDKIELQICEGKLRLLDNNGNLLVPTGIMESDSEVEVVFDETANLRISTSGKDGSDKGYGTNSLLEQWRDSYPDNDDYYPYKDDMYENHDLSKHLQSICDDLDIMVYGRKKK